MEVPQKIPLYTFFATLGNNGILNIIFFKASALECIFSGTCSSDIFSGTSFTINGDLKKKKVLETCSPLSAFLFFLHIMTRPVKTPF